MCFGEVVPLHWAGEGPLPEGELQDLPIRRDGGLYRLRQPHGCRHGNEIRTQALLWERISLTDTIQNNKTMSRVFRVIPKRIKRTNGQVLTPDMSVVVTTKTHATSPFTNGAQELKEAYMRLYGFDYQKAFRYGVCVMKLQ